MKHRLPLFAKLGLAVFLLSFAQVAMGADETSITFNKTKFVLMFSPADSPVKLREYLPRGQTLEKWTLMLSSRRFPDLNDPLAYAQALAEHVNKSDTNAKSRIYQNDKTGQIIVDFLVFSPTDKGPQFAEWNLMKIDRDGEKALWVCQYAHRFYKIDDKAAQAINSERENLLEPFAKLPFPK